MEIVILVLQLLFLVLIFISKSYFSKLFEGMAEEVIEKYKTNLDLNKSLVFEVLDKLGECWAEIYIFERGFKQIDEVLKAELSKGSYKSIADLPEQIKSGFTAQFEEQFICFNKGDRMLEKNRFWIDKQLYKEARDYHNCFLSYMAAFKANKDEKMKTCLKDMTKTKNTLEASIEELKKKFNLF